MCWLLQLLSIVGYWDALVDRYGLDRKLNFLTYATKKDIIVACNMAVLAVKLMREHSLQAKVRIRAARFQAGFCGGPRHTPAQCRCCHSQLSALDPKSCACPAACCLTVQELFKLDFSRLSSRFCEYVFQALRCADRTASTFSILRACDLLRNTGAQLVLEATSGISFPASKRGLPRGKAAAYAKQEVRAASCMGSGSFYIPLQHTARSACAH